MGSKNTVSKVKTLTTILLFIGIIITPIVQKAHCESIYENNTENSIYPPKEALEYTQTEPIIVNENIIEDNSSQLKINEEKALIETDKRQFIRFNINSIKTPVSMTLANNNTSKLLDISRGGVAISNNKELHTGDIIPVKLNYKDIEINTDIKIIYTTEDKAGGEFTNLDTPTQNQLLYLSIVLEADNNMLKTKFSS